jgi:hypothetical protein
MLAGDGVGAPQPLGVGDNLGPLLGVRPPALALATAGERLTPASLALAQPGSAELLDEARFFQLREDAGDLPHGDPHFVVAVRQVIPSGREHTDPEAGQRRYPGLLHHQRPGKPACILNDHHAQAVADDALEERPETGTDIESIGAAHCWIAERLDDGVAGMFGEALDRGALARASLSLSAPTFAADDVRR